MIGQKDLNELIEEKIITEETATDIKTYYLSKKSNNSNRLLVAFGILGATLIGLGIILILAHNWDNLSKIVKTIFAFTPLVIGQAFSLFALIKKQNSTAWKENSSAFLFFAIASSISLVAQIYNINGNMGLFLFTWVMLSIPIIYIMNSRITSILTILVSVYFILETGYSYYYEFNPNYYWLILLLILPYYFYLLAKKPTSNFTTIHNWIIPISLTISLGSISKSNDELMFLTYLSLFGFFYIIGNSRIFSGKKYIFNGYKIIGLLGSLVILLSLSFDWFWNSIINTETPQNLFTSIEFISFIGLTILSIISFVIFYKKSKTKKYDLIGLSFIPMILIFFIGFANATIPIILVNLLILTISVLTINKGTTQNHLGILNYGLIVLTTLVICRFFDTNISFIIRGSLFVIVGVGFFFANYLIIKKRKS
jgi:uncharacterized membrane protein